MQMQDKMQKKIELETFRDCVIELIQRHANCHCEIPMKFVQRKESHPQLKYFTYKPNKDDMCVFLF